MEKSWKIVEAIRDGKDELAHEAAVALARAVLEERAAALASAVLQGGPHALRQALELAEVILTDVTSGAKKRSGGSSTGGGSG